MILPGMRKMGASSKNSENFAASSVAEEISNFRSDLNGHGKIKAFVSRLADTICKSQSEYDMLNNLIELRVFT
jgi:hypothetical protein